MTTSHDDRITDLRSDTVTVPGPEMREFMARAEVGDDLMGEDPTVSRLSKHVAAMFGKRHGVFTPSGTMANLLALLVNARRGDHVIVPRGAHVAWYESAGSAVAAGVEVQEVGRDPFFTVQEMEEAIHPAESYYSRTSMVWLENTHNRGGGLIWPVHDMDSIAVRARELGLRVHLDGSRIWNAHVATGVRLSEWAAHVDTMNVCFSKGLGAPVGSMLLVDSDEDLELALRMRKMLGGSMRQSGFLAAAALYAVEHNISRLKEDHARARALASMLRDCELLKVSEPQTNIIMVDLPFLAHDMEHACAREGVLFHAFGPKRIRLVTHMHITEQDVSRAASVIKAAAKGLVR